MRPVLSSPGPALLKTYAVWAGEEDRVLFYDNTGVRFAQVRLSNAPDPSALAKTMRDETRKRAA